MYRVGLFPLVAVLIAATAGLSPTAVSGEQHPPHRPASATTLGTYWYYGTPEYHCREFSTVCGYIRPLYYGHYRSKTYADRPSEQTAGAPARLGRVHVADVRVGTEKTAPLERYGAFTRIKAPGNAARWVRSDTLVPAN